MFGRVHFKGPGLGEALDAIFGDVPHVPADFQPPMPTLSHPNRNPNSMAASPTGAQVRRARMVANMTAGEAGALIYERATRWLAFEEDRARMHPASWELWNLKLSQRTAREFMAAQGSSKDPHGLDGDAR